MTAVSTARRAALSSRGMTLPELLMAALIGILLMSVVPPLYFASLRVWRRETGRLGAVERADWALRRMYKESRNAMSVTVAGDGKSVTLILPKQRYDADMDRDVNELNANDRLTSGNQVRYYFTPDPHGTGSRGGALYRRITHADGSQEAPRLVAENVYPGLNPLRAGTTEPRPLYSLAANPRALEVSVTAAEPKPSAGTFMVRYPDAECKRDGGELVRVGVTGNPEGEVQCALCGAQVLPTAEIAIYTSTMLLRNSP